MAKRKLPHFLMAALVLVHIALIVWAVMGLAEMMLPPSLPWPPVGNPLFPTAIQLSQWLLVLAVATVFIVGLAARWRRTPLAMAVGYALMAALCAVETIGYLKHDLRYPAMALEYAAYIAILLFLFRSRTARNSFAPAPALPGARPRTRPKTRFKHDMSTP
jgi:hypothetical protein